MPLPDQQVLWWITNNGALLLPSEKSSTLLVRAFITMVRMAMVTAFISEVTMFKY